MTLQKRTYHKGLFLLTCLCSTSVFSATQPQDASYPLAKPSHQKTTSPPHFRSVASLLGGVANLKASGDSQSFTGTDDDIFTYRNQGKRENTGFVGAFIGVERQFGQPPYYLQAGVQYNYFGVVNINGVNSVGVEPATSTNYQYRYRLQAQQLLAVVRLFTTTHKIYHPFLFAGIGAAFNRASEYDATTTQTDCINLTPTFDSNTQTSFSYALGVGVDTDMNNNIRIGLGYQFADLGRFSLGNGKVTFNQYSSPVTFAPGSSHVYTNTLFLQISYRDN